jgi:transcriptional regulator with XRE-family HTH domain
MTSQVQDRPTVVWRAIREARGLSLREAARRADIQPAQLSRVERGMANLTVASMLRLARVLRVRGLVAQLERVTPAAESAIARSDHDAPA